MNLVLKHTSTLSSNPAVVYLAGLAPGSRRTMQQSLSIVANAFTEGTSPTEFPWHELRYSHTTAIRSLLKERYAPATGNKILAATKGVLKECFRLGKISSEDYHRAIDIPPIKGNAPLKGRALTSSELLLLLEAINNDSSIAGVRDKALFYLLRIGLRRSEITSLTVADIKGNAVTVRRGKGAKTRTVYLPVEGTQAIAAWLVHRQGKEQLFVPISKSKKLVERPLCDQAIMTVFAGRARGLGIAHFSPHDFRRTFASQLIGGGVDISTVQQLMGHASVTTTQRYDRRGEEAKVKAADFLSLT